MRKIVSFCLMLLIVFTVCIPVVFASGDTITVNASVDNSTKLVTITGNISSGAGKEVTIQIVYPSGVLYVKQVTSGAGGDYNWTYKLTNPVVNKEYKVKVGGDGIGTPVSATFTYTGSTSAKLVSGITVTGAGDANSISAKSGTLQMQASVLPADATDKSVTWTVEHGTGSATISTSGLVTAVSNGTVTVSATANDGSHKVGTCVITISGQDEMQNILVSSISVIGAGGANTISTKGGSLQMQASVLPDDATNKAVTWTVKDGTGSAAISTSGLLTAVSNGTVTVSATAKDGSDKVGTCVITISGQIVIGGIPETSPSPVSTATPTPTPTPVPEKVTIEVKPEVEGNTAKIVVDPVEISKAFEQTKADESGVKTIQIDVKPVDGVKEYLQELPRDIFNNDKKQDTKKEVEIKTPVGTIIVPDNMFKESDIKKAENVGISIGVADISGLKSDLKAKIGDKPVIEINATVDGKTIKWKNNDAPVEISIDYKPTTDELKDAEHIVVWYVDGAGKVVSVPSGRYDPTTGKVTFTTTHFSKYAVAYVKKTFSDIGKYPWIVKPVEVLASKGIIEGTTETAFKPDQKITRGEFIMWLVNTLGLTAEYDSNFSDIKKTDNYYEAVAIAKKLDIARGGGGNKFSPDKQLSRQDMMTLTVRALKVAKMGLQSSKAADLNKYSDYSKIAKYAADDMAVMVKSGMIQGSGKNLNPTANATRAETAIILYRIYNK